MDSIILAKAKILNDYIHLRVFIQLIESQAVSWTRSDYCLSICPSVKEAKGLESIPNVKFTFTSCCCEPDGKKED